MESVTYKKFNDRERAEALAEILTNDGIELEITEDRNNLGSIYGDKTFTRFFYVNIRQEDFAKADAVVLKADQKDLESIEMDHYLYSFTDEELFDILSKPDEWNALDYQLSQKILKERGKEITQETIALLKSQRIKDLSKPEPRQRGLIAAGYIFAALGGVIGIFIGWHVATYKRTLPNGQQMYGFQKDDRMQGRIISIIGSIMFVIYLLTRFSGWNFLMF